MKGTKAVVGVFTYLDDIIKAIDTVKEKGHEFKVYSPTYVPELEQAIDKKRSPVGALTLTGALLGITGGFALAILCSLDYPLRVSAKAIVAPPAFVVVGYECTILFGAIFTLLGILHFCKLPDIFRKIGYDERFSDDKFGLVVSCEKKELDSLKGSLSDAGADEVNVVDSL